MRNREATTTGLERKLAEKKQRILELEKLVEEQGRELEKLEGRLERTKGEFLMGMGYAIRTPMNGIMGMTNLVLESDLTAEQRSHLEMVNSSAERLLEVVNDILDFYRIEAGTLQLAAEDFRLSESLDYELYLLKLSARQKNLDFSYQVDRMVPEMINSDPDRLVQVLSNLVDNAIKFTETGSVDISVEYLGDDEEDRPVLKFLVNDTGIGIARDRQIGIKGYLNRNDSDYARTFRGGGLGLTISGQLVRLAGGEIGFQSTPGQGASFWFTWKCNRISGELSGREAPRTRELSSGGAHFMFDGTEILLAEDEPISRVLIETLLDQVGLRVRAVENGRQAVAEALTGSCRAVLMDVQMPVMDGLEATRLIRKHEREHGGHLPVIALTAHALHGDREKCLQAGMDDYLAKPLNKDDLYDILTRYLTRTALVVLGDVASQQRAVEYLIERGWRVTIAETGRSALYEASLRHFDLVLLDMGLEAQDGAETARMIRRLEEYSGRQSLIIAVKDERTTEEVAGNYRAGGVDVFLAHPLSVELLEQSLEHRF